jgi:hypothetical protein
MKLLTLKMDMTDNIYNSILPNHGVNRTPSRVV